MKALILIVLQIGALARGPRTHQNVADDYNDWKDRHPQQRQQLFSYRMQCHSCMSPYLEEQFTYISHLYRRPLAFTEKCDFNNFDGKYMRTKNCTDLCVSLRMHDKVGGRRRSGYMRGCMSDIIHYNRSVLRDGPGCYSVRLRDLFVTSDRYAFEPSDRVDLCPCSKPFCNGAASQIFNVPFVLIAISAFCSFVLPRLPNYATGQIPLPGMNHHHVDQSSLSSNVNSTALESQWKCDYSTQHRRRRIPRRNVLETGVS